MNHPDWPAFVAAIIAQPDDDTLRLVAADFLEENGDPDRAAFIRVQVALARLEASELSKSPEAAELRKKERVFLDPKSGHRHLWARAECPEFRFLPDGDRAHSPLDLCVEGVDRLTWVRGFIEEVACDVAEWLRHGVTVRQRNPVRVITLNHYHSTRDDWYVGLSALRGLSEIQIMESDEWRAEEILVWLRQWLPETTVTRLPF